MHTADLAIQVAAVEAILYLCTKFPQVAERCEFCFFPVVADAGSQPPITIHEDDP